MPKYLVKKVTEHRVQCKQCMGVGKQQNGRACMHCNNGVAVHWHETEIDLIQALNELGLIKQQQ